MKCEICNIIFASKVPNFANKKFYNDTSYISEQDALMHQLHILKYLKKYLNTKHKINALEIGTGVVYFYFLKKLGFSKVMGVEPSKQAILLAKI